MTKKIVLAGGCFWGLEDLIRQQPGVIATTVGYAGGDNDNPTYENHPGHAEAVEIEYDAGKTTLRDLLDFFFQVHDPTTMNRQGNDKGTSYRSAVFYSDEGERAEAEKMIAVVNASGRWKSPVVTTMEPLGKFYPAEDYHQDYLLKNPGGYTCHFRRFGSYFDGSSGDMKSVAAPLSFWPRTKPGLVAVSGLAAFAVGLSALLLMVRLGETGGEGFFSNLKLAFAGLLVAVGGVTAFVAGDYAIIKRKESGALVGLAVAVGFVVTAFVLGEIVTPH